MPKEDSKVLRISITIFLKGWCFESARASCKEIDIVRKNVQVFKVWRGCRNRGLYHICIQRPTTVQYACTSTAAE